MHLLTDKKGAMRFLLCSAPNFYLMLSVIKQTALLVFPISYLYLRMMLLKRDAAIRNKRIMRHTSLDEFIIKERESISFVVTMNIV